MTAYLPETRFFVPVKRPETRSPSRFMQNGACFSAARDLPARSISRRSSCAIRSLGARIVPSGARQAKPLSTSAAFRRCRAASGSAPKPEWTSSVTMGRSQLAVEPCRAIGVDLGFKVQAGKQAKGRAAAALGVILCGAGLEVFRDAPMVGVDALDDSSAAQCLQPSHVALDIGVVVTTWHADAASFGHGAVGAGTIVARSGDDASDIAVCGTRLQGSRRDLDDRSKRGFLSRARRRLGSEGDMMDRPSTPSMTRPSRSPSSSVSRLSMMRPTIGAASASPWRE